MKISCHNKSCSNRQVPVETAFRDPRDHQLYCGEACANGCNPPRKQTPNFIVSFVNQVYEKKFEKLAEAEIPVMEFGIWD